MQKIGKKQQALESLYSICKKRGTLIFNNDLVKKVCVDVGFGNPFDVTKIDNREKLPPLLAKNDIAVIHLGGGRHKFIKGINKVYHSFEPITHITQWRYEKSLLNQFNSSESNILSVANNQRILHNFLFNKETELTDDDIAKRAKTYFPHRTKTSLYYTFGSEKVECESIQIEIDLTIEFRGIIGVFEGKNGQPDNFSVYQIYHPFLYYHNAKYSPKLSGKIKKIYGVYVVRENKQPYDILKLWCYTFTKPNDITSIQFLKSAAYELIPNAAENQRIKNESV